MTAPYYHDEASGITIYHGDCREMDLTSLGAGAVVTDPPYGLGKRMSGGTWGTADKYAELWAWDVLPPTDLILSLTLIGPTVIWGGHYFPLPPSRCWLIWDKRNAVPTVADCEMAWTNLDRPTKRLSAPVGVHDTGHPTQKPIQLMRWTLGFVAGGTILDPFMGSGTTLVAAKQLGRRAIGIELEERYCEIAAKRLAQDCMRFEPVAEPKGEQAQMFEVGEP